MNKTVKTIIIVLLAIIAVAAVIVAVFMVNGKLKTKLEPVNSSEELSALVDKIYEGIQKDQLPMVQTQVVDITDNNVVQYATGLENGTSLEYLVLSEPLMSSQAYSLVLTKVKSGVNASEVAKEMSEKVDTRKWICVEAEKLYATSSGDIVFLVMSNEETAKPIYENFKILAGKVSKVYEKSAEEIELLPERY